MAEGTDRRIDFYFDFISHNAYLMWEALAGMAERHGYVVSPIPVLFAGFLKAHGTLGPAEIAPKIAWMNRNNLRKAAMHGIPLNAPLRHPFRPLLLLRLAAQDMGHDARAALVSALFRGVWVDRLDPEDPEAIAGYLEARGCPARTLLERAADDDVKARVRLNTEACLERGGFGVPSAVLGGELFWGFDDLPQMAPVLAGRDPLAEVDVGGYETRWEEARSAGRHRRR